MKPELRNKDSGTALDRYKKSFFHAIDGMIYAWKNEHNIMIIFFFTIFIIISGFVFKINSMEWLFCIFEIEAIIVVEFINSAIEAIVDLASPKIHPLAKIAKDTASSATLILCISAFVGGVVIFLPKVINVLMEVL
ncbi:MAG: diacylglycerol kinase family protein [Bacilli bacterium]